MARSKSSVSRPVSTAVSVIVMAAGSIILKWACAHADIILKCLLKAMRHLPRLSRYRCLDMLLFVLVFGAVIYLFFDQFVNTIVKFATIPYIIVTDMIIMFVYWGVVRKKGK